MTMKPDGAGQTDIGGGAAGSAKPAFDLYSMSDVGTERTNNEDSCKQIIEGETGAVFAVADGVGGYEGGEVASAMAVEVTLQAWQESPASWGPSKRLYRAVQRANIEIHNKALVVPELRRMATTLTVASVIDGTLDAAHVGDCRLYLARQGRLQQVTKDHTMVAERVRLGLMSAARARNHPDRSALSRCLGHELIVSVDRITMPLQQGDRLILCTDGLYNVLEDTELQTLLRGPDAKTICQTLIDTANQRGAADNVTAAVFIMNGNTPGTIRRTSLRERIARVFGRS